MEVKAYYQVQVESKNWDDELYWSGTNFRAYLDYNEALNEYNYFKKQFSNKNYRIIKVTEQTEVIN